MVRRSFLISFILLLAVIIYNCDDAGKVEDVIKYPISGTVENWSLNVKKLRAVVTDSAGTSTFIADSTTIASDGSFQLNMKSPPDNFFFKYTIPIANCTNGVAINPSTLKNALVAFNVYNDSYNYIGKIERKNYVGIPVSGSFWVNYFHYNTNGSVLGDLTCRNLTDTVLTNFNLVCTNSWKPVVGFADSIGITYQRLHFNNTEPPGGTWKFSP